MDGSGGVLRLVGGGIGVISGVYSLYVSTTAMGMAMPTMPAMLVLGIVVLVHGAVLLSPAWVRIRGVSGPLMVLWGLSMVALQAVNYAMFSNPFMVDAGMVAVGSIIVLSGGAMWRYGMRIPGMREVQVSGGRPPDS